MFWALLTKTRYMHFWTNGMWRHILLIATEKQWTCNKMQCLRYIIRSIWNKRNHHHHNRNNEHAHSLKYPLGSFEIPLPYFAPFVGNHWLVHLFFTLDYNSILCVKSLSRVWLIVIVWTAARQAPLSMESPGRNTGAGRHFLLQGVFLTQELNPCLPDPLCLLQCRQILFLLCHWGSKT